MNELPSYILKANVDSHNINYLWDDSLIDETLQYDYAQHIISKIDKISLRAKIILGIGVYEWILGRLGEFASNPIPFQVWEVALCANIDKNYATYMEFEREDYIGPIEGALWCGFTSIIPMLYVSDNITDLDNIDKYDDEDSLVYGGNHGAADLGLVQNIALVLHILPQNKIPLFKSWLDGATNRLIKHYTMPKDDPFANLFGYKDDKDWLGDYVAREVLDLDYPYHPKDAVKLCDQFLQQVDYRNNPLLVPPQQLTGKIKHPYRLLE